MKQLFAALISTLFLAGLAHADCVADAAAKQLKGAARTSFVKKCEADAKAAPVDECAGRAAEKKLKGAAKTSFLKKCEADAAVNNARARCEAKAADKKLKGAAKTSFLKKCEADARIGR